VLECTEGLTSLVDARLHVPEVCVLSVFAL
jgi:hypothetical protein